MLLRRCFACTTVLLVISVLTTFMILLQSIQSDELVSDQFAVHRSTEQNDQPSRKSADQHPRFMIDRFRKHQQRFESVRRESEDSPFDSKEQDEEENLNSDFSAKIDEAAKREENDRFRRILSHEGAKAMMIGKGQDYNEVLAGKSNLNYQRSAGNLNRNSWRGGKTLGNLNFHGRYPGYSNYLPSKTETTLRPDPPRNSDFAPRQPNNDQFHNYQTSPQPAGNSNLNYHRREPTLITALFDIGRGDWDQYKRPYSMYQDYMRRLLSLDVNLFVFADAEGAKFVREHRASRMEKTRIQEMSIQQLPLYAHYGRIKDLIDREQSNWSPTWDTSMKFHPESISADYDILMNSKPYFVYSVANWNPFESEYFYWLDAGYGHGQHSIYPREGSRWSPANLMTPEIGGKITFIQLGPGNVTAYKLTDMYRQGLTIVNGGFFGGNKQALGEYYHLHNRIFVDLLSRMYVDDDQTLTVLCYHENPNLFNMVVGDWYDVFRLFHE